MNKILVTGCAGFIGYHLCKVLCENNLIIGIDNLNDYYDVGLKNARLEELSSFKNFNFIKGNISNDSFLNKIFQEQRPNIVVNLAAQAGVRYSIDNPKAYIESNMIGFFNILEVCRHFPVDHLVYASSSSVYGNNEKVPYSTDDNVDNPISLYAASKKSNELMAHSYSKLYNIPSTGLRFFTAYGPFGRPDMAYFKFTDKIVNNEIIQVYNNGDLMRDFTYIEDIVDGIIRVINKIPNLNKDGARYKIYNIGNSHPERLLDFIDILEKTLLKYELINKSILKEYLPMQAGDVYQTYADMSEMIRDFHFSPTTSLEEGIDHFVRWYKDYYKK